MSSVYTLTLVSDGESDARVFKTEEGRDAALEKEVIARYCSAQEVGTTDLWKLNDALDNPCEFISDQTHGETDVYLDEVHLED
jgi:hypothetical protein